MRVKNNKGMTLIALVITIILLFILAGVAISSITGEGLFGLGSHQNEAINKEQELNNELKNQVIGTLDKTDANHDDLINDYMCKEHKWDNGTETKPATCTEKGEITYKCTNKYCTATRIEEIDAKGHTRGTAVTTASTCIATGTEKYFCTECNQLMEEKIIPALGHNWDSGKITKVGSCTEKGEITKTCQRCGITEKTETSEAGHSWNSGTLSTLVNCTYARTRTYKCTKCNETKQETVKGKSHTMDAGTVTKVATCTENGSKTYTCKVCEASTVGVIKATGHSLDSGTVTKVATCIAEGQRIRKCANCTYSTTQTTGYDPSNHYKTGGKYTTEKYYNPDYTPGKNSAGQVVHYYDEICSRCKSEVYPITEKNVEHCAPYWEVIGGPYRKQAYYSGVKLYTYGCDHIKHVTKVKCTICDQMFWCVGFHYIANTTTFTCSCGRYMGDIWPEDGDWSKLTVYNPYAKVTNPPDPRKWTGHTVNSLDGTDLSYYYLLGWVQYDGWTKEDEEAAICPVEGCNKCSRADYDNIY